MKPTKIVKELDKELIKQKNRFLLKEIELWNEHEKKKSRGNSHPK